MTFQPFLITSIIAGPTKSGENENVILECLTDKGEMIVFLGKDKLNTDNVNLILKNKLPLMIACSCIPPEPWGIQYGHKWWIPEDTQIDFE